MGGIFAKIGIHPTMRPRPTYCMALLNLGRSRMLGWPLETVVPLHSNQAFDCQINSICASKHTRLDVAEGSSLVGPIPADSCRPHRASPYLTLTLIAKWLVLWYLIYKLCS